MFQRRFRASLAALLLANVVMWCTAAKADVDLRAGDGDGVVRQERVYISVTLYVSSICTSVGITWYIARLWHASEKKAAVERALTRQRLERLEREMHGGKAEPWDGGGSDGKD